jgi:ABC-type molybdate transport system substrate-binding protein
VSAQPEEIMVFATASLTESFEEIGEKFKEKKNVNVVFNFAGSQTVATSITQGAKADVFVSANINYTVFFLSGRKNSASTKYWILWYLKAGYRSELHGCCFRRKIKIYY